MLTINTKSFVRAVLPAVALALGAAVHIPAAAAAAGLLTLDDIESRVTAQGIQVKSIELRDLLVEVEGRDANAQKVELLIDRRSGDVLSREVRAPKLKNR